ncbi:hypothetical protein ZEAMMB73_Zm00001d050250 [Zea mays]|uniref:Uncharacterized protein n=1 Tax=Zea mays TaxID=4577 RepID=A0A1D6Q0M6_MAIZE|nr:hypothetical protein ZEAMMB73_Zm00001d050250 [Zea mays]
MGESDTTKCLTAGSLGTRWVTPRTTARWRRIWMPTSCLAEYRRSDLDASATLSSPHKRPPAFTGNTVAPTTPPSCQTYADQVAYVLNFFQIWTSVVFSTLGKLEEPFELSFFANSGVMVKQSFVCMYQQLKCKHDIIIVEYRNNYLLYLIAKSETVLL